MVKLLKIIRTVIGISFEWVVIFVLLFSFAIRTSPVQTYLAKIATTYLSSQLKAEIKIEKVSIVFINEIALDGVLIKDLKNDTIAHISTAYITLNELNPKHKFIINQVEIENSVIKVSQDKKTRDFNYQFILDYFASTDTTSSSPLIVELKEFHVKNTAFYYDDYKYENIPWGMDYDHLKIKKIDLDVDNITVNNGIIRGDVKHISAVENSGFILNDFSCNAKVSEKGIYTKNLIIKTPNSRVYGPKVNIVMNHYTDYFTFVDSANFDGYIVPSKISMVDIAYFAPQLQGMNQVFYAKGVVTRKTTNLKIRDLELTTGDHSRINGTFVIPDLWDVEHSFLTEQIDYAYVSMSDLKKIKLPISSGTRYFELSETIERLGYIETKKVRATGFQKQFSIKAKKINTQLGGIEVNNEILFSQNKKTNSYHFNHSESTDYTVKIDSFKLNKLLLNNDLGKINGNLNLKGEIKSFSDINFTELTGKIDQFDYLDYSYKNISIEKGKFVDNIFDAQIDVKDENLNLTYNGVIDLNGKQHFHMNIGLSQALLDKLHLVNASNSKLKSNISIDLTGNEYNNLAGTISMDGLVYSEGDKKFQVSTLDVTIDRNLTDDLLLIQSNVGTASFIGKVDFNTIIYDFENQISKLFPAIIPLKKEKSKNKYRTKNNFNYKIETSELNQLLSVLLPELKIAPGTKIEGHYNGITENALMTIHSKSIQYGEMEFEGVSVDQQMNATTIEADYSIAQFYLNDSINVSNLSFTLNGDKNILYSKLNWNPSTPDESSINWNTSVLGIDKYNITLLPSYFSLKEKKWNILNNSTISINRRTIDIGHFLLERDQQYLSVDGRISEKNEDRLNFRINDFKLDDFSSLLGSTVDIKGLVNGWGYISNPYSDLTYIGDANIQNLFINQREVGNIFVQTQWNKANNSLGMTGDLIYRGNETFGFDGYYYISREENNLDFNLTFDNTDIQFTNAFMDPEVLTNIRGFLTGQLNVNGTFDNPKLNGSVELVNGNARLELMNVNYGFNGKIMSDASGFYINNMPITDEEGNTGSVIASIYHKRFADWNFDVVFNLEDNGNRFGVAPGRVEPLDRFLVMNTSYKKDEVYYGKGYGTGIVEISGYTDNLEINVDLQTQEGTKVNFPMYGMGDIDGEDKFITFKSKNEDDIPEEKNDKLDLTGLDLKMNFKVTPEAVIKIILDDKTGDEITATGSGDIAVSLDNLNDVTLNGVFKVKQGDYNFVMRPINQEFIIQENSSVIWTGDPYNALVDLKCYYTVYANLNEISSLQNESASTTNGNQEIKCYLNLTESILKPAISFDIQAPKAKEDGQSLLNRIKGDKDMLNKQFFSLLLFKKFQSIDGQTTNTVGGSSAALDIAQSKINALLSEVSKDYKLNVGLDKNNLTLGTSYSVGVTKGFYGDRLVLKGNFGVENTGMNSQQTKNLPIGDVNLEYILNKSGTFRVNIFNESNQNRILSNNQANFTQGAGIQYQEEFNSFKQFQLYNSLLNVFTPQKSKRKVKSTKPSRKRTPLPK